MKCTAVCLFLMCLFTQHYLIAGNNQEGPTVFVLDAAAVAANKKKISQQDAQLMPAYRELLKDADTALLFKPVSVMEKKNLPPSGDRHNYMSTLLFQEINLADAPAYALRLRAEAGVWVETSDGKYKAYVFVNSVNKGAGTAVISILRYTL